MSEYMFDNLVETRKRVVSKRAIVTKLMSAGLQFIVIALLVLVPLFSTGALPPPQTVMTFMAPLPPPPPPPPPAAPPAAEQEAAPKPKPKFVPKLENALRLEAPAEVPNEIAEDVGQFASEFASDFGVPGGVEAGIPGGVIGGVEGGIPGAPPQEPVRVGGQISPPRRIQDAQPRYPETARSAKVQGTVVLETIIDPYGRVANVRVLKSIPLLDQAAIEAVQQWRFEPTMLNGIPVPIVMTVTVNFDLA